MPTMMFVISSPLLCVGVVSRLLIADPVQNVAVLVEFSSQVCQSFIFWLQEKKFYSYVDLEASKQLSPTSL